MAVASANSGICAHRQCIAAAMPAQQNTNQPTDATSADKMHDKALVYTTRSNRTRFGFPEGEWLRSAAYQSGSIEGLVRRRTAFPIPP